MFKDDTAARENVFLTRPRREHSTLVLCFVLSLGRIIAAYLIASLPLIVLFLFTMKLFICGLSSGAVKGWNLPPRG